MRVRLWVLFGLLWCGCVSVVAGAQSKSVAAEPSVVAPGQTVTLKWYFTGDKVTVSGGGFGTGKVVTGRTSVTDQPKRTTRYTFRVSYRPKTGKDAGKPIQQTYSVVVEVSNAVTAMLKFRSTAQAFQVFYLKGWKCDSVKVGDVGKDALVYFQQREDSVERLAVAVLPASSLALADLSKRIRGDLYSLYDEVEIVSDEETTSQDLTAQKIVFKGVDHAHPGTRIQSVIFAFVRGKRGYVVSARTHANRFAERQAVLEKMVRSFRCD